MSHQAPAIAAKKSDRTRARLFQIALELFRRKGFDATTMRDIAARADLALGAAYYYFPSKDAIVMDYYSSIAREHEQRVKGELAKARNLQERLILVVHSKLDLLREDRPLLDGLFRFAGSPSHPLSVFGAETSEQREKSIALFRMVLDQEKKLPDDARQILPTVLWALHLALILYFIHDDSPSQHRTKCLLEGVMSLLAQMIALTCTPLLEPILAPVRRRVLAVLREAKLLSVNPPPTVQET